ncbi:MAG TPA: toll/interleukin-1 receptor domain-containing protein [Symbiobacteriaceae bacterium]
MKDFFISYNTADRHWAEWIAGVLEQAGKSTVIQAWDFPPGSNFVIEMDKALQNAHRLLAVLSPDFLTSRFTAPEWAGFFAADPTGEQRKLVPVLVRKLDGPLKGLLGPIVHISLLELNEEAARQALLDGLAPGRHAPPNPPPFPGGPDSPRKMPS